MNGTRDVDTLWREFKLSGDRSIHDSLVVHYTPLVKYVAGRVRAGLPDSIEQADLVSDGVIGLMDAIEKFDLGRGLQFQTYAVPRIRGAIIDGLRAADWVPRAVREDVRDINEAVVSLERRLGRSPMDGEVATELAVSVTELRKMSSEASYTNVESLEANEFGNGSTLLTFRTPTERDDGVPAEFLQAVRGLRERDQIVVALYYWEGLTLSEIGQVLRVSESRVSQLHKRATRTLRHNLVNACA